MGWIKDDEGWLVDLLTEEFDKGYKLGLADKEHVTIMEKKLETMQALLDANSRVLRKEIEGKFNGKLT